MFARHALSEFVPKALAAVASAVAVGIERKRADEALRQSEERFAKVFAASPVGIAITTLDDERFLDANAAFLVNPPAEFLALHAILLQISVRANAIPHP